MRTGDVQNIQRLFRQALAGDLHFLRDKSFINYLTRFPGVNADSIFIAEANDEVVGFSVVSILEEKTRKVAMVLEFQCLESSSPHALAEAVTSFCSKRNVDAIISPTPFPSNDHPLQGWMIARGLTQVMMAKQLSFSPLLKLLLHGEAMMHGDKTIVLQVGDEKIRLTSPPIPDDKHSTKGETRIIMSPTNLLKIIFGQQSPLSCLFKRNIRVSSPADVSLALKMLKRLRLKNVVYISPADRI